MGLLSAVVAELVDALVLGTSGETRKSSSLFHGTILLPKKDLTISDKSTILITFNKPTPCLHS